MWVRDGWGHLDWRNESEEQELFILLVWQTGVKADAKHTGWSCLDPHTLCATARPHSPKQGRYTLHHSPTIACIYLHSAVVCLHFVS